MYKQIEALDKLLERSGKKVLVLKHSTACPISGRAKREVDGYLEDNPGAEVYLVVVQERREVSNELEEKLGVRHETPQLLLIENGEVVDFWSHHGITREVVEQALG